LASEDPRSTGLEEDSEGGQGPHAVDMMVVVVMNLQPSVGDQTTSVEFSGY